MPLPESENKIMHVTTTNRTVGAPSAVDRRRNDRIAFPFRVQVISHELLGDKSYDGMCTDISEEGVAFETEANLFLQSMIELVFEIENKIIFRSSARLLYRVEHRYGAYFGESKRGVSLQNLLDRLTSRSLNLIFHQVEGDSQSVKGK
jgi:PilZ domain